MDEKLQDEKIHSKLDSKYLIGAHFKYENSKEQASTSNIRTNTEHEGSKSARQILEKNHNMHLHDGEENIDILDDEVDTISGRIHRYKN